MRSFAERSRQVMRALFPMGRVGLLLGLSVAVWLGMPASLLEARNAVPTGLLAVSVGEQVIVLDPASGRNLSFETGPVGWLFPAPGGVLFAPDVINGTTSVINLRKRRLVEVLDGVTMPHFGDFQDRYISVGKDILLVSYPDRAILARVTKTIDDPWQVEISRDGTIVLILARKPNGEGGARLVSAELAHRKVLYDTALPDDVRSMELVRQFGVLAMIDPAKQAVLFVTPGTLNLVSSLPVAGQPIAISAIEGEPWVAVAEKIGTDGAGRLLMWKLKTSQERLIIAKERSVVLSGSPHALAESPDHRFIAVALDDGRIDIVQLGKHEIVTTLNGPGPVRDLKWCDPLLEGPIIEHWSDEEVEPVELGVATWDKPKTP